MSTWLPDLTSVRSEAGDALGWFESFLHPEPSRPVPVAPAQPIPAPAVVPVQTVPVASPSGIQDPGAFFKAVRGTLWPHLTQLQVDGCQSLLMTGAAKLPLSWMAYVLATAYHETAYTMQPIKERGSGDRNHNGEDDWFEQYDVGPKAVRLGNTPGMDGDGAKWCGRGYCMITGENNYSRANIELHKLSVLQDVESLLDSPELALRPDVAAAILVVGMLSGWFTGKSLRDYIPSHATSLNYVNARRIINGVDRAQKIAGYAVSFDTALKAGNWL